MSNEYTELEIELMNECNMLRQNVGALKGILNSAQVTMKELVKPNCEIEVYDWAEFVLRGITKIKRSVSFRETMFHKRYPNA